MTTNESGIIDPDLEKKRQRLYQEFGAIDRDNSGQISREEFSNWLYLEKTPEDHIARIVNDVFREVDTDGSG